MPETHMLTICETLQIILIIIRARLLRISMLRQNKAAAAAATHALTGNRNTDFSFIAKWLGYENKVVTIPMSQRHTLLVHVNLIT